MKNPVVKNALSLLVLQGSNYILPLITFPYLVRILEPKNYGLLLFMSAFIQYFIILTDYGFNYSATRHIAIIREDVERLKQYCNTILTIKMIMTVLGFLVLIIIVFAIPMFRENYSIYLIGYLSVLGNALFPIWFFQGMEQMKYITVFNLISKFFSTVLIFIFVKHSSDYNSAALLQSFNYLLPGIIGLLMLKYKFSITLFPTLKRESIKRELANGWSVFIANISGNIYGQGAVFITGLIGGTTAAAYYGICQKITGALVGITQPIAQALYPYLCREYVNAEYNFFVLKRKLLLLYFLSSLIISGCLFLISEKCINLVANSNSNYLINLLKNFSIVLIFILMNVQLNSFVLALNKNRGYQLLYASVAVIFLVLSVPMTFYLQAYGMFISITIVEMYIFAGNLLLSRRGKIDESKSVCDH